MFCGRLLPFWSHCLIDSLNVSSRAHRLSGQRAKSIFLNAAEIASEEVRRDYVDASAAMMPISAAKSVRCFSFLTNSLQPHRRVSATGDWTLWVADATIAW